MQQAGDVRSGHDHPPIDVEGQAVEPGFLQQVRGRNALTNPAPDQPFHAAQVRIVDRDGRIGVEGEIQGAQHEVGRFVMSIVGAVAVVQSRGREATRGPPHQRADVQGSSLRRTSR